MSRFLVFLLFIAAPWVQAGEPKPFGGKVSEWNGFAKHDFVVDGKNATVVVPEKALDGRPWAWRAEFFGAFPNADIELVKKGWHVVYLQVPDLYGSPKAMASWEKLYDVLVKDHGLHAKPAIIGLSRGALYALAWGVDHPDKTLLLYLDNGFCDPRSWPTGVPKEKAGAWGGFLKAYDFKDDEEALGYKKYAIDRLEPLAKGKTPILLVFGDSDKTVPHLQHSEIVFKRYSALGCPVEKIVKKGSDHHPHGLPDPAPIVKYFERVWSERK